MLTKWVFKKSLRGVELGTAEPSSRGWYTLHSLEGGGGTWACWVCAAGLSERLPHYKIAGA